jgi:membrane-bound lytic murein transglycosylase D
MVLKAGSTILVPKTEETAALDTDLTPEIADNARLAIAPDVPETRRIYVKAGKRDTLAGIASRYRVTVAQIKEWNGLKRDTLAAGQSLQLQIPNVAGHATTRVASHHRAAPARRQVASAKAPVRKAAPAPARKVAGKPLTLASGNDARKQ